ncbi:hypothetical protein Bca101_011310 [Brassica carinata]
MEFSLQDDEFGGDFPATNATRASGSKRSFNDLEDDEDRIQKGETEIVFPGVSLALLFFTVLSFRTLMTATLQWEGISATVGLAATVVYPLMQSRLSTLRTGLWSLWSRVYY